MKEVPQNPNTVYCSQCGTPNPVTNKFCYGCGGSLSSVTCSFCSTVNPQYAKFCGSCGKKLGGKAKT